VYRKIIKAALAVGSLGLFIMAGPAMADDDFTAADLMRTMSDQQQYIYISGVVAGLGTARYVKDGNDTGSACISRWFFDTEGVKEKIYAAFTRFGDKSPSAILYALITKECGK
jgi:hypothetical protein